MKILSTAFILIAVAVAIPAMAQSTGTVPNPFGASRASSMPPNSPFQRAAPPTPSPPPSPAPAPAARYTTPEAARQACGADPVVWGNTSSRAYHAQDSRLFGKTKRGAYLCQSAAERDGFHAAGQRGRRALSRSS